MTNYPLINHLICTIPDTEQIVILILHYLIIQKPKNVICTKQFPYGTAYQNCLKIALESLHSKNKLTATSWHFNLSNVLNYHQILAMSNLSMSTVPN